MVYVYSLCTTRNECKPIVFHLRPTENKQHKHKRRSFIPCTQALIGVVDGIYTRIASNETVSVQQSTFTLDLSQMNTIFRQATEDSLVVVRHDLRTLSLATITPQRPN